MKAMEHTERKDTDHDQIKGRSRLLMTGATKQFKSCRREDKLSEKTHAPMSYISGASLKWEKGQGEQSEASLGSLVSWVTGELVRVAEQL